MTMITCPNPECRRPNRESAVYCVYCGHKLHEKPNSPVRPSRSGAGKAAGRGRNGVLVCLVIAGVVTGVIAGFRQGHRGPIPYEEDLIGVRHTDKVFDPSFEMPVTTGAIVLESRPKGARIRLDGKKASSRTPAIFTGLSEGEHEVRVEYRRLGAVYYFDDRIVVRAGTTITRRYDFFPDR